LQKKGTNRMPPAALPPDQLFHPCDISTLGLDNTSDIATLDHIFGQQRAIDAMEFGISMGHEGYNIYVSGSSGLGKRELIDQIVRREALSAVAPDDWCYLHNFDKPHEPIALRLPAGQGRVLQKDMEILIDMLLDAAPAAFKSEDYRKRVSKIQSEFQEQQHRSLAELAERARQHDVTLMRTPNGYTLGPVRNGELLGSKEFDALPEQEQKLLQETIETFNNELQVTLERIPLLMEETRTRVRELNIEFARFTIDPLLSKLQQRWQTNADVVGHLHRIKEFAIDNFADFLSNGEDESAGLKKQGTDDPRFIPYRVNALIDNAGITGVPVYYEDNPTYQNLIGRIEHISYYGALITNFTMIKAGAVHKANGGYLIVDARKLLSTPFAWEGLQRVLETREIRVDSLQDILSLSSTISLQPQAIPANFKVVLYGPRFIYYLLKQHVPQFGLLFKVHADFAEEIARNEANTLSYARWIAALVQKHTLLPVNASGIAAMVDHLSRLTDDGEKTTLSATAISDLACEADHVARKASAAMVDRTHVETALQLRRQRQDQWRELMHEEILRGTILISTAGETVGQINGLSILDVGEYRFGKPTRITATARLGNGKLLDIEREANLGGPIHSKGVMILGAYIANTFAQHQPLALSATLVFEQSYSGIEGDSASAAELCVLLSAIAALPLKQQLAMTGSVNQHGQIQPIGGVNEKIEGFFDVCTARSEEQDVLHGVIIPATNIKHLMLRKDVIDAVSAGRFVIYAISHINEAIELLTGLPAGVRNADDQFPADSANGKIQARIDMLSETAKKLQSAKSHEENGHEHK